MRASYAKLIVRYSADQAVVLAKGPRWHTATVLPDASNQIRKIRIYCLPAMSLARTEGLESRCSTADSPTVAPLPPIGSTRQWLTETDIVPFGQRVSTVHGVVFRSLRESVRFRQEGQGACLRIAFPRRLR